MQKVFLRYKDGMYLTSNKVEIEVGSNFQGILKIWSTLKISKEVNISCNSFPRLHSFPRVSKSFPRDTKSWERVVFFSFACPFAGSVENDCFDQLNFKCESYESRFIAVTHNRNCNRLRPVSHLQQSCRASETFTRDKGRPSKLQVGQGVSHVASWRVAKSRDSFSE